MGDLQGLVYFDGERDYIFRVQDGPLNNSNTNLYDEFEEFEKASLALLSKDVRNKSISIPTKDREDEKTQEFMRFILDSTDQIRIVRQGGQALDEMIRKYGFSDFQAVPFELAPGLTFPGHVHKETTEAFYVKKGIVIIGKKIFYEGEQGCFRPNEPHNYVNPLKNSQAELILLFSPNYDPQDWEEAELEIPQNIELEEQASYIITRTDIPLFGIGQQSEPKYIIFIAKEFGEKGPIALKDKLIAELDKPLEEVIIYEGLVEQDPRIINGEVNHTNSILIAGSLQSSYIYTAYKWFDKLPKMVALYSTPEAEEFIREAEIAGDYLLRLRTIKEQNGDSPINLVFVESKTSQNAHLKYKERVLERCKQRGISVTDVVYQEGSNEFSLQTNGSHAVLVECLDRISLVKDLQDRFGSDSEVLFRAFNPLVLDYYTNNKHS